MRILLLAALLVGAPFAAAETEPEPPVRNADNPKATGPLSAAEAKLQETAVLVLIATAGEPVQACNATGDPHETVRGMTISCAQASWRRIIENVRAKTRAPLTYSAGWDSYEKIGFWDALDVIGIQSYFPLVDHEGLPTPQELETSWSRLVERLDAYAARHDRKIVFGELGYNRSSTAALRPWEYQEGGDHAEETQRRCLSAALRAIEGSEAIVGAFLWKWFPGEMNGGNFQKSTPAMREVIRTHWGRSEDS